MRERRGGGEEKKGKEINYRRRKGIKKQTQRQKRNKIN
jgi:hypothetical protein